MASDSLLAPAVYQCYYCQSVDNSFKYFNNHKLDQRRHQCHQCHKLFTVGTHGRPQGRTYAKKRNEDPAELKSLSRQCRHCGVADNAVFKYYNNKNRLQPRFKCLSCGENFQMRLMGTGNDMRLVHTSCNQRQATRRCKKPAKPEEFTNASNFGEESYQASDGSFMQVPFDLVMPPEPNSNLLPESCEEDVQYASLLEAELTDENESVNGYPVTCDYANYDNYQPSDGSFMQVPFDRVTPPLEPNSKLPPESCEEDVQQYASLLEAELTDENVSANGYPVTSDYANVDNYGLLPEWSAEEAELRAVCEFGSLTDENERAPNADPVLYTFNEEDGLPPAFNAVENAEFLAFLEAGSLTDGKEAPWNHVDTFSSTANIVDDGLLPWSDNDAALDSELNEIGVMADESKDAEMVSENMPNVASDCTSNPEVASDTPLVETLAAAEPDSWSNDTIEDASNLNYLDAALACSKLMDMVQSKPVAPVQLGESSSSNARSTISFGDSSCATSKRYSFQQDLMEEDQCAVSDWNGWQDEEDGMEMAPWS